MNLSQTELRMDTEADADPTLFPEDVGELDAWTLDEAEYTELEEMQLGNLGER